MFFFIEPLEINNTFFDFNRSSVSCISISRPADAVRWYKDGIELLPNLTNSSFSITQSIVDPFAAVYRHDLFIDDIVGVFKCEISDFEGNTLFRSLGNII